jgi:ribosomal protein RSM22 (predicted rRNA methylase)
MFDANNHETFRLVLRAFSEAARKNYGDHAFEAGYLQSLSNQMLDMMPKKYQRGFIDDIVRATRRQEQEVIKKMNENKTFERV